MTSPRNVVTIDGLAASGKSRLGRELAAALGYRSLNSGEIYRAFAWGSLKAERQGTSLEEYLPRCIIVLHPDGRLEVDEAVLSDSDRRQLHTLDIANRTSRLSALPPVRAKLLSLQQGAYDGLDIVAEGRDMGTVVFPDALAKFFVTATPEIRARRRFMDDPSVPFDTLVRDLAERDARDASRPISPTIPAIDAIVIENDDEPVEDIVLRMLALVRRREATALKG